MGKGNVKNSLEHSQKFEYQQVEYIDDMNEAYAEANVIISRAGASSVSELKKVGKPVFLIPYPAATDNHQYYNALNLKEEVSFLVEVIDHKLKGAELANEIKKQTRNVNK